MQTSPYLHTVVAVDKLVIEKIETNTVENLESALAKAQSDRQANEIRHLIYYLNQNPTLAHYLKRRLLPDRPDDVDKVSFIAYRACSETKDKVDFEVLALMNPVTLDCTTDYFKTMVNGGETMSPFFTLLRAHRDWIFPSEVNASSHTSHERKD